MISASSTRGSSTSCLSSGRSSWSVALLPNTSAVEPESATEQAETSAGKALGTYSVTNKNNKNNKNKSHKVMTRVIKLWQEKNAEEEQQQDF